MVPQRRHQRALATGARSAHLGRMGGRERRSGTRLRMPVAQLADRPRRHRPDRQRHRDHPRRPALPTHHRQQLERRIPKPDGIAAMPLPVPVPCARRQARLPAVPAFLRHVPRRAVQHRGIRAPDHDGRPTDRLQARTVHLGGRRHPHLQEPPGTGREAA